MRKWEGKTIEFPDNKSVYVYTKDTTKYVVVGNKPYKILLYVDSTGLSGIACLAIILVLPAAMSRASWLALISGSIVVVYMYYAKRFPLREYYLRYNGFWLNK